MTSYSQYPKNMNLLQWPPTVGSPTWISFNDLLQSIHQPESSSMTSYSRFINLNLLQWPPTIDSSTWISFNDLLQSIHQPESPSMTFYSRFFNNWSSKSPLVQWPAMFELVLQIRSGLMPCYLIKLVLQSQSRSMTFYVRVGPPNLFCFNYLLC